MQGGGRLLQLFLTGHGDGGAFAARLAALRRLGLGFCRCFRGSALLTIRRETGSRRWTLLAMVLPTAVGMAVCMLIHGAFGLLG